MGSEHKGHTHRTGRRRVEIEWDERGTLEVPHEDVETTLRDLIESAGGMNIEIMAYDERGYWESRFIGHRRT